jgi:hypothetical protein
MTVRRDAEVWCGLVAAIESIEEGKEKVADKLERLAHARLQRGHRYARSGMYPRLVEVKHDSAVFHISNGIDVAEDFRAAFALQSLMEDEAL